MEKLITRVEVMECGCLNYNRQELPLIPYEDLDSPTVYGGVRVPQLLLTEVPVQSQESEPNGP
jgi:hypothetical protein